MPAPKHDPLAETAVLPQDEVAIRRIQKRLRQLTRAQMHELIAALAPTAQPVRRAAEPLRLIEDQPETVVKLRPVPEDFSIG